MTNVLVIGSNGQVGWELTRALQGLGHVQAVDYPDIDLAHPERIPSLLGALKPQVIVNAAAYTAVDDAEASEDQAHLVNATAVGVLADCARRSGALLVHYSTDYVFDGTKDLPYLEEDKPAPLNAYGRSKLAGENVIRASSAAHLILRTSWVYASRGRNFLKTILRVAAERDVVRVVSDQIGAPTWARFVAQSTAAMLWRTRLDPSAHERSQHGETVNLTSSGATSWHGFASRAIRLYEQKVGRKLAEVEAIESASYPVRAARPKNSRLDLRRLEGNWGIVAPDWSESLTLCVEELA